MVLLGNSVVASSLASTLRSRQEFEVIQIETTTPDVMAGLRVARPDAIILCEQATTPPLDLIFLLLAEYPGVPVIRADVGGDRMVVLSGRQAVLRTEDDLLEALRLPAGRDEQPGGEVGTETKAR